MRARPNATSALAEAAVAEDRAEQINDDPMLHSAATEMRLREAQDERRAAVANYYTSGL